MQNISLTKQTPKLLPRIIIFTYIISQFGLKKIFARQVKSGKEVSKLIHGFLKNIHKCSGISIIDAGNTYQLKINFKK